MTIDGYFDTPFATSGDKTNIPDATDPSGYVSYEQGYTSDYNLPISDPDYKPIERDKMNDLFYQITTALQQYQQKGTPPFITTTMNGGSPYSYSLGDEVISGGVRYVSLADTNTTTPPGASWSTAIPAARGGTGRATLTANNVILGNGTSPVQLVAPGTSGNVLTSNGSTWSSSTPASGLTLATVFNTFYPVGTIYYNKTDSTNPGTLFGLGTWVAVTDKFLVARGSTYTSTGGSATVTLGVNNLPPHTHSITGNTGATGSMVESGGGGTDVPLNNTGSTGSADPFSIIPPYQAVYAWERTA